MHVVIFVSSSYCQHLNQTITLVIKNSQPIQNGGVETRKIAKFATTTNLANCQKKHTNQIPGVKL